MHNAIFDPNEPVVVVESPNMKTGTHAGWAIGAVHADERRSKGYPACIMNYTALTPDGTWARADEILWLPSGANPTTNSKLVQRLCAINGIVPAPGTDLAALADYGPVTVQVQEVTTTRFDDEGKEQKFTNSRVLNVMTRAAQPDEQRPPGFVYNGSEWVFEREHPMSGGVEAPSIDDIPF